MKLAAKNRTVCIANTSGYADDLKNYIGVREDITNTTHRMLKMARDNVIKKEDVSDYCSPVVHGCDAVILGESFDLEDRKFLLQYMCDRFPHEYNIFDVDIDDLKDECNRIVIENADCVILNVTQSIKAAKKFEENKNRILRRLGVVPMLVVVNKYCDAAGEVKELANWMGIKNPNRWFRLRYNPWIQYGTNKGKLSEVGTKIRARDFRVADVDSDLNAIAGGIQKIKTTKRKIEADRIESEILGEKKKVEEEKKDTE